MANFTNTADIIGDEALVDSFIDRSITECHDDTIVKIGIRAFHECPTLTSVNLPRATSMMPAAFWRCSNLISVELPQVSNFSQEAFSSCSKLSSINAPKVGVIGRSSLSGCRGLTNVKFPIATIIHDSAFYECANLTSADFPMVTYIGNYAFLRCSKLAAFILRSNTICRLYNYDVFYGTPLESGAGFIYVPSALIDSYKADANWSTYDASFRALEEYTVDGTTTGELDPTKI